MTFRTRLVLAATAAVLVVVVLGAFATYIVASHSLIGSVDVTLTGEAKAVVSAQTARGGIAKTELRLGPSRPRATLSASRQPDSSSPSGMSIPTTSRFTSLMSAATASARP